MFIGGIQISPKLAPIVIGSVKNGKKRKRRRRLKKYSDSKKNIGIQKVF